MFAILALLAVAAGCSGPYLEERLDPMIGQDVDVVIEMLGQVYRTVELGDRGHRYVWERLYEYDLGRQSEE